MNFFVDTFDASAVVKTTTRLHVAPLRDDIYVVRLVDVSTVIEATGDVAAVPATERVVVSGFVDRKNLALIKQRKPHEFLRYYVVHPSCLKVLQTEGWGRSFENWINKRADDPYGEIVENGRSHDDIVRIDSGSNMVFDLDGNPYPIAIEFEYINFRLDESTYDLTKAVEILLKRNDVLVYKVDYMRSPNDQAATNAKEAIHHIPGYNAEPGRTRTISFRWMPDVQTYRQFWKQCLTYGEKHPSVTRWRAVFDADMLGLRAGGAAYCNNFFGSRKRPRARDE